MRKYENNSGLECHICKNMAVDTQVWLYYKTKLVEKFESVLKAQNYAMDKSFLPCIIKNVYVCGKCFHEETKRDMYFTGRIQ